MQASAFYGFRERGIETAPFYGFGDIQDLDDLGPEVGLAGYLGDVWDALDKVGATRPPSLDYPEELREFLCRDVWQMPLKEARQITHRKLFVKPAKQKLFTGFVTTGAFNDQVRLGPYNEDEMCWVSDVVNFVSEYRCFILRGDIISANWYKGDWGLAPERSVVEAAVKAWSDAPVAYTLDFGVTDDGKTLLVEVNDGYSMGGYGIKPVLYSQMLDARWTEMTHGC
jgi:hypothetical protein